MVACSTLVVRTGTACSGPERLMNGRGGVGGGGGGELDELWGKENVALGACSRLRRQRADPYTVHVVFSLRLAECIVFSCISVHLRVPDHHHHSIATQHVYPHYLPYSA